MMVKDTTEAMTMAFTTCLVLFSGENSGFVGIEKFASELLGLKDSLAVEFPETLIVKEQRKMKMER